MPTATIEDLKNELTTYLTEAKSISDAADTRGDDFTDDERGRVVELTRKAEDASKRIKQAKGDRAVRDTIASLGEGIEPNEKSGDRRTPSGLIVPGRGGKSIGRHYVESAEYKGLLDTVPGGHFSKDHRVQSRPVGFDSLIGTRGSKALVTGTSDTSGGAFVQNDQIGLQVGLEPFERPLTLRNLVTQGTTTSDTIEYVRVTSITNNAAPVAEATTAAGPTQSASTGPLVNAAGGGYKPESALATAKVTTPVRTIAHWIPVTKRALSDAAQMSTLIDSFLQYGLEEELEDQMIAGDGTGENFEGLGNVSGVQAQAYATDLLTTTRKAKTKVRLTGRSVPNGYVLNPADLESIELIRDNSGGAGTGSFMFGGPAAAGGATSLWGLPVIESEAVPAGVGYVGDFRKCVLWDREQSSITTTDSHLDFFVRNLVAILAEMRAGFGVLQPSAFVEIGLTP